MIKENCDSSLAHGTHRNYDVPHKVAVCTGNLDQFPNGDKIAELESWWRRNKYPEFYAAWAERRRIVNASS